LGFGCSEEEEDEEEEEEEEEGLFKARRRGTKGKANTIKNLAMLY